MKIRLAMACLCLTCLWSTSAAGDQPAFRDYARVVAVEPILETSYQPSAHRVCPDPAAIDEGFAATVGEDVRRLMHHHRNGAACRESRGLERRDQVSGYWVTYEYGEHRVTRRLSHRPGDRLAVDIRVNPLP